MARLEQGPWTDVEVERQFALFLASGTSHQSDTKVQTYVSCHVGSIHLRIPSSQLVRTLQYVDNMKDDALACFILLLMKIELENTARSRETMAGYNTKNVLGNDVIKPRVNVIGYS